MQNTHATELEYGLAATRVRLVAFGLGALMAAWFAVTFVLGRTEVVSFLAGSGTALLLVLIGLRYRAIPRVSIRRADQTAALALILVGLNVLLAGILEGKAAADFWMPLLVVAAGAAIRRGEWFGITATTLTVIWFGGVALGDPLDTIWLQSGIMMVCAAIMGGLLCLQTENTVHALNDAWLEAKRQSQPLEEQVQEVRRLLARKTDEVATLESQLRTAVTIANNDELTGLANRHCLRVFLDQNWAAIRHGYRACSAICVDVRGFHEFNREYGYETGDQVLLRIGDMLRRYTAGELKIAARIGGDRFLLILPGIGRNRAAEIAAEIDSKIALLQYPEAGVDPGVVHASFGVATVILSESPRPHRLIAAADESLARAKSAGGAKVVSFPAAAGADL